MSQSNFEVRRESIGQAENVPNNDPNDYPSWDSTIPNAIVSANENGDVFIDITDPNVVPKQNEEKGNEKNPVYLAHKIGKQIGYWGGWAVAFSQQTTASYRAFTEQYRRNPTSDVFLGDPITAIYGTGGK